jgi:hypothetical protein
LCLTANCQKHKANEAEQLVNFGYGSALHAAAESFYWGERNVTCKTPNPSKIYILVQNNVSNPATVWPPRPMFVSTG